MQRSIKRHLPLKDFFDLLCSLKFEVGWAQAPGGHSLIRFLSEKAGISQSTILKRVDELTELGYIQKGFRGKIFWRIKILIPEWDESRLPKKQEKEKLEPAAVQATITAQTENQQHAPAPIPELPKPAKPQEKRFAVFMDYKNLEMNLPRSTDKFRNFSWLLDPIIKQGKIIFAFVFIPDHYVSRAPIMQLTHKHHFHAIFCPRKISGTITKEADTVDAQMQDLAWALIEHSNITDVVIVTGDADFQLLATHARWQQKVVTMVSTEKALSGKFLEMERDGSLALQLVR